MIDRVISVKACELVAAVTALAIALADILDEDTLVLAATVFTQLGDTLATIAAASNRG